MTKPQSLRAKILEYVEAAYLYGLPVENLDTGELELHADIKGVEWIADSIIKAIEHRLPEKKTNADYNYTENFEDAIKTGYNQAISEVKSILKGE